MASLFFISSWSTWNLFVLGEYDAKELDLSWHDALLDYFCFLLDFLDEERMI